MAVIMPDTENTAVVTMLADSATAQLRVIEDHANREQARRLSAELRRISAKLDRKHGFPGREVKYNFGKEKRS